MTTQLPDRLRDLADDAPASLSAAGLWHEGRRRHRRRVSSAALVTGLVVALVAGTGVGAWRSARPEPAAPPATSSGPMPIPDQLYNPSPWTPTTRTPGRLVAAFSATRDSFPFGSDRNAVVGVAAGSQTYRFLQLPGQSKEAPDVELSPDGRHLAYWLPRPAGRPGLSSFAVLDLSTGSVQRFAIFSTAAPYGVYAQSLSWLDPDSLALVGTRFASRQPTSESGRAATYLFTLGHSGYAVLSGRHAGLPTANVADVPVLTQPQHACAPACPGLFAQMVGDRRMRVQRQDANSSAYDVRFSSPATSVAFDSASGWVAATRGRVDTSGPTAGRLVVGRVEHGRVALHAVPGPATYDQVTGWVDATHVTTVRQTGRGLVYDLVDVRTGGRRQLTSKPWYSFQVAQDALLHATTVPGVAPPAPWNPRWLALGVLVALACAGAVGVALRTRVRRVRR